ncbi:hypothetical protein [Streptomyces niveus]|uniref:hypothetical protein n=1 Tax=Streptomyces niveus TaxID=193462 RepID=UPI0036E2A526
MFPQYAPLKEIRDRHGNTTTLTRLNGENRGEITRISSSGGKRISLTYDPVQRRVTSATDARGITYMTNEFYADGRVKEQTFTEGARYTFAYTQTGAGKVTSANVTQPGGSVRRVEFDADGYGVKDTEA